MLLFLRGNKLGSVATEEVQDRNTTRALRELHHHMCWALRLTRAGFQWLFTADHDSRPKNINRIFFSWDTEVLHNDSFPVSALYSTHLHLKKKKKLNQWLSRPVSCFHTYIERSSSTTTTHTLHRLLCFATPTHKKVEKPRSALWSHYLKVWCQKPCERHCEQRHRKEELSYGRAYASCIINMDWTLTLLVQLICVIIPQAAVQTSPGFTVHWLLQNYSSSL